MLFNGRALIFTISGTQVRIAEHEHLQSLFNMSMVLPEQLKLTAHPQPTLYTPCSVHSGANLDF